MKFVWGMEYVCVLCVHECETMHKKAQRRHRVSSSIAVDLIVLRQYPSLNRKLTVLASKFLGPTWLCTPMLELPTRVTPRSFLRRYLGSRLRSSHLKSKSSYTLSHLSEPWKFLIKGGIIAHYYTKEIVSRNIIPNVFKAEPATWRQRSRESERKTSLLFYLIPQFLIHFYVHWCFTSLSLPPPPP